MATILLSAAGAALGGSIGGTALGLSSVAIGRAVGATLGRVIDERLLGSGSDPVETGKIDRFRMMQAGDGQAIARVFGRMRVGGQVIWASDFLETVTTTGGGGGKGAPSQPAVTSYSYSVSLAVAVCEGEIAAIPRIWADGEEIAPKDLNMRLYRGTDDQLPDPLIETVEGEGQVPAYRGTAYVVFEDLRLEPFGNRVPQFAFELIRPEQPESDTYDLDLGQLVKGVALMPGTGEYALASTPVHYEHGLGQNVAANSHTRSGETDILTSLQALDTELPACGAASLIVSWFGDDLRCGSSTIRPKVEQKITEASMPWSVAGLTRASAEEVLQDDGRPVYGGTPADASVIEAIQALRSQGKRVMFYPFILMDQAAGNGLPDPWTGAENQPALPWRGRITLSVAPGRTGTQDETALAGAEVAAFFGTASADDFTVGDGTVTYSGPPEWGLRRFILHQAALCAAAGGVAAFCIGSELRGLTQIRDESGFPAVDSLRNLAAEVRSLLGPETKISYAADWSEYFGYTAPDGNRYFHLDPLWADANIDFIGIDNYMPLSDWRDGTDHLDAGDADTIYDPAYLRGNIEGGEGYDWYYHSDEARAAQIRTPITDGAHGEPWIWRFKDLKNWWRNDHYERIGGVRQATSTAWVPQSKPIWFTELGCAAIDKGTNQPNKFLDPKSSESLLPRFSNGNRDDFLQLQYLRCLLGYWRDAENNPVSNVYGAPMLDMENAYVWAWDARPFPAFPNALAVWSDGENYMRGHWLNGRAGMRTLASVVAEVCSRAGLADFDVSKLHGIVRGYTSGDVSDARAVLQPLTLRHGFDAIERDGQLLFRPRLGLRPTELNPDLLAESTELDGISELTRAPEAELAGRVRLRFAEWGGDHSVLAEEAILPDEATHAVASNDLPMALTRTEARQTAERWLAESRVARTGIRFGLPPSALMLGAGDVISMGSTLYRIDRVAHSDRQLVEAARIEPETFFSSDLAEELPVPPVFLAPVPVDPLFLDLPLMRGDENPVAPHLAVTAAPWPGRVAVYDAPADEGYALNHVVSAPAASGVTMTALGNAGSGRWDEGAALQVKMTAGTLESRSAAAVLNGANLLAIGDGTPGGWELLQFREAELIAPQTYLLRGRLRGQLGTDALMPEEWPVGSRVVLLDGVPGQIPLSPAQRRIARHFRIGPAGRGLDDPSYLHRVAAFDGNGLRPYSPVHLRSDAGPGQDMTLSWIRRTRIDGDSWDLPEVPMGEEAEIYRIQVKNGQQLLREVMSDAPAWSYNAAAQAEDGFGPGGRIEVAQVSGRYGAGPVAVLET